MIAANHLHAEEEFYRRFPSCEVYLQKHCDELVQSIGSRMNCYRNFIANSKSCQKKTRELILLLENSNREIETQGKAAIKSEASTILEANYTKFSGIKIDQNDSNLFERIEAGQQFRSFTSFINRIMLPGIKDASPKVLDLIAKAKNLNQLRSESSTLYAPSIVGFKKAHEEVLLKIKSMTSTYDSYVEYFRPRFEGLRNEQNRNNYLLIFEKTRLLVQEAYDMESSLISISESVSQLNRRNDLKMQQAPGVTKGELTLQKLFQTLMKIKLSSGKDKSRFINELEFYHKLCKLAYSQNPVICDVEQGI
jgi:hypothetical protein